ncbi:hypothetical protein M406DRAFT_242083, partial [Cryphonectria parasitica EP155]
PAPKNWPAHLPYLTSPSYASALTKTQLRSLRSRPTSINNPDLREVPLSHKPGPSPNVKITPITDPHHPAFNQAGLFATRALSPGCFILPYLGEIHMSDDPAHTASDYDLWLTDRRSGEEGKDDDNEGVAVDAARMGNEARFANDYRGVPGAVRPNAEFCELWDARRGERGMGVFVLPASKKMKGKGGGIGKGQEILVSYGKGFWDKRRREVEEED